MKHVWRENGEWFGIDETGTLYKSKHTEYGWEWLDQNEETPAALFKNAPH